MLACLLFKFIRLFYGLMLSCETDGHEGEPSSYGGLNTRTNDHTQAVTPEGVPKLTGCRGTTTVVLIVITCPAIHATRERFI